MDTVVGENGWTPNIPDASGDILPGWELCGQIKPSKVGIVSPIKVFHDELANDPSRATKEIRRQQDETLVFEYLNQE